MQKLVSVFYTTSARKDLRSLDASASKKIVLTIQKYTSVRPLTKAKALSGIFEGLYRYRIGDYRVLFEYDESGALIIVTIMRIKHRKNAYR
jgi:mRNA interferase RelE/StbE